MLTEPGFTGGLCLTTNAQHVGILSRHPFVTLRGARSNSYGVGGARRCSKPISSCTFVAPKRNLLELAKSTTAHDSYGRRHTTSLLTRFWLADYTSFHREYRQMRLYRLDSRVCIIAQYDHLLIFPVIIFVLMSRNGRHAS